MGTVAQPVRHNYARFTSDVLQRSQICGIGSDEGREKKRKEKRGERHDSIAALPTYEFVPIWLHFLAVSSPRSEELNKSLEVGRLPCSQRKKPFFFTMMTCRSKSCSGWCTAVHMVNKLTDLPAMASSNVLSLSSMAEAAATSAKRVANRANIFK